MREKSTAARGEQKTQKTIKQKKITKKSNHEKNRLEYLKKRPVRYRFNKPETEPNRAKPNKTKPNRNQTHWKLRKKTLKNNIVFGF
jgi:hypothetical protein